MNTLYKSESLVLRGRVNRILGYVKNFLKENPNSLFDIEVTVNSHEVPSHSSDDECMDRYGEGKKTNPMRVIIMEFSCLLSPAPYYLCECRPGQSSPTVTRATLNEVNDVKDTWGFNSFIFVDTFRSGSSPAEK